MRRTGRIVVLALTLLGAGCTWLEKFRGRGDGAQTGDVPKATADKLVARLNQNAAAVQVVHYPDVSITLDGPDVPIGAGSLANSSLTAARPKLFLLRAGKNVRSELLTVGSNDREFWLYGDVPGQDRMLLVCAHDDFPKAAAKLPVPIDPDWALVALGMAPLDPESTLYRAETDTRRREYRLIREATTPSGRKVEQTTVFSSDEPSGSQPLVRQHLITEPGGRKVIARADITSVWRVPGSEGAEVPTDMTLEWPEQRFKMRLKLRQPTVNEPLDPARLTDFNRPELRGVVPVNLADATFRPSVHRGTTPGERRGIFGLRRD